MLISSFVVAALLITEISSASVLFDQIDYTYFNSEIYPDYGIRYVRPTLCDPNVTQQAEPNREPSNSMDQWRTRLGVWFDNGPCRTQDGKTIEFRENTWTYLSNMFYMDQPSGTGYSYGEFANTVAESTPLYYIAIQIFYEAFPKYSKLPLHVFGESAGGRMATLLGSYIVKQNLKLEELLTLENNDSTSKQMIPLKSVALGNGVPHSQIQLLWGLKFACDPIYNLPFSEETCRQFELLHETCVPLVELCRVYNDDPQCKTAVDVCVGNFFSLFATSGRHVFDIRRSTDNPIDSEEYLITLQRPDFQKAVGARPSSTSNKCNNSGVTAFMISHGEGLIDTVPDMEYLLNHNISMLVYAGDLDFGAHWISIMEYMSQLNFNGIKEYNEVELRPWVVQDEEFGEVKDTDKLTFLRVHGAGHEVAYDAPAKAFKMFDNWINNKKF
ncbi:unnamed protein product [Mucor hiemalis]